jgi:hypothetical protein
MVHLSRVRSVLVALALLVPVFATAAPHRVIDLKRQTDTDGIDREISFCTRPSPDILKNLPGHAFVAFSTLTLDGKRSYTAIGHTTSATPVEAVLTYVGLISSVSGHLEEEKYISAKERCLVVRVNKQKFDAAFALTKSPLDQLIPDPKDRPPVLLAYKLGASDCMNFMIMVAKLFQSDGLNIPERDSTELPLPYLRKMIDAN